VALAPFPRAAVGLAPPKEVATFERADSRSSNLVAATIMPEDLIELTYMFRNSWPVVARAYLGKYPHPKLSHVESVDTLERYVDLQGRLVGTRIITSSFLKFSQCVGLERSLIDPAMQEITLQTENINYTTLAKSMETCHYRAGSECNTTLYTLTASLQCSWTASLFLKSLLSAVRVNFGKGTKALESIMHTRMGIPYFASSAEFERKWQQSSTHHKKFKLLTRSNREIDTFLSTPDAVILEILKTLEKEK